MSDEFLRLAKLADPADVHDTEVLLDTNVALEIYTIGDLLRAGDEHGCPEAALTSSRYRYRQLRARYSTILGWWLAKKRTVAGVLGNEFADLLDKVAPPTGPKAFTISHGVALVVMPGVLTGLRVGHLVEVNHLAVGENADSELFKLALRDGLPLVTNEGLTEDGLVTVKNNGMQNLRGRCKSAGVEVFTPQEFLALHNVNILEESRRFLDRCTKAVAVELKRPHHPTQAWREMIGDLVPVFRMILLDEVDARYTHISRPRSPHEDVVPR